MLKCSANPTISFYNNVSKTFLSVCSQCVSLIDPYLTIAKYQYSATFHRPDYRYGEIKME